MNFFLKFIIIKNTSVIIKLTSKKSLNSNIFLKIFKLMEKFQREFKYIIKLFLEYFQKKKLNGFQNMK